MRTTIAVVIFALILAVFCPPIAAQTTPPIYLFSMETKGVSTGTIHVYSVNSSTGALTEVPGSPFNAGLIPAYLVVDPTGRFVYVGNEQSADITAFSVDSATGALTELPGSPFPIGSSPQTMAIDPTGRFLYVSAATLPTGSLYEYLIDSVTGALTAAVGSPFPRLYPLSIVFNPEGNYAYLAQGSPDPGVDDPILICTVDFTSGTLTPVGSVQPAARGANVATVSPGGSFLFSIDPEDNLLDGFAIGSAGSSATEDSGSPYAVPDNPDSLVVHPTGNFLYVVNEGASYQTAESPSLYDGAISVFAIDSANGTLAPAPGSPFAAGINPTSIVVDPTGSFAYSAATTYTTGYTSFAQVMGFSINASSGVLTPFPGTPWTDWRNSAAGTSWRFLTAPRQRRILCP